MTPEAYYYISLAYLSIAGLTGATLLLKGYNSHKMHKYMCKDERQKHRQPLQYVLHSLHIPPYLIASYWYYDAYKEHITHST